MAKGNIRLSDFQILRLGKREDFDYWSRTRVEQMG